MPVVEPDYLILYFNFFFVLLTRIRGNIFICYNKDENSANNVDISDRNLNGKLDNNTERVASDRMTFLHF